MPRSNRPRNSRAGRKQQPEPELNLSLLRSGVKRIEVKNGVPCWVQPTSGKTEDGAKTWVCPNCTVPIAQGMAHVVAWPEDLGVSTRRHFHNRCWDMYNGHLG